LAFIQKLALDGLPEQSRPNGEGKDHPPSLFSQAKWKEGNPYSLFGKGKWMERVSLLSVRLNMEKQVLLPLYLTLPNEERGLPSSVFGLSRVGRWTPISSTLGLAE